MDAQAVKASLGSWLARMLLALPAWLVRLIAGRRPAAAPALHPEAWLLARLSRLVSLPHGEVPPPVARRHFELQVAPFAIRPATPIRVEDRRLPGPAGTIPARLYAPRDVPTPAPLLVYYHGGGFVLGSLASHDATCRLLAQHAGVRVLAVDYRLAPEHPFPAAVEDALAAYAYACAHAPELGADPARIAVGGDSAGGNLAAVTALGARDEGLPAPAFQLLVYPVCDQSAERPSYATFGDGFLLTREEMRWFDDCYLPDRADRSNPRASPLLAADLAGLPPAYVATSAADPLRDEGEAYAARLRDAGVPVALHRHQLLHGFINLSATRAGREGIALVGGALRQGLGAAVAEPARSGRSG